MDQNRIKTMMGLGGLNTPQAQRAAFVGKAILAEVNVERKQVESKKSHKCECCASVKQDAPAIMSMLLGVQVKEQPVAIFHLCGDRDCQERLYERMKVGCVVCNSREDVYNKELLSEGINFEFSIPLRICICRDIKCMAILMTGQNVANQGIKLGVTTRDDALRTCANCFKKHDVNIPKCSRCDVHYCDAECQNAHWSKHKERCKHFKMTK